MHYSFCEKVPYIIYYVGHESHVYYELESFNKTIDAIIDPNYELPNISRQNLSLKNIIGEGMHS